MASRIAATDSHVPYRQPLPACVSRSIRAQDDPTYAETARRILDASDSLTRNT